MEDMRNRENIKLDVGICILLLFVLGLFPDICYYYLRDQWDCIDEISRNMAGFFFPMGITYQTASEKIMNLAGVIITVVGLIISTYMNLMQRLEKNDYGITYKEMQDPKEYPNISHILNCTRMGSYFAPILLIFILNFRLCFTGYILYLFCWLSVFLQVRQYVECLKEEKASERVVKAVLRSLPDAEEWRENDIQLLDIKLDEMSNGIQKARNWSKVNGVFEAFAEKMVRYAPQNQTILSELFCRHFCCGQGNQQMPVRHMWNLYLSYYNQERCPDIEIENQYAFFGGWDAHSCHLWIQMIFVDSLMMYLI